MRIWNLFLGRLLVVLLSVMLVDPGSVEAAPQTKKAPAKPENNPIVGELDEGEGLPPSEDDEGDADEVTVKPLHPSDNPKIKGNAPGNKGKTEKEKVRDRKAKEMRRKLLEEFKKTEDFHKSWYNLPIAEIKTRLAKLTAFCKGACTKSQCNDEEVANHCHLMCPAATTRLCPDPLKKANDKEMENAEALHTLTNPLATQDQMVDLSADPDPSDEATEGEGG